MRWRRTRSIGRLLAINIEMTIEYRGGFLVMQAHNLVTPIVSLLVWEAVLASGAALPVSAEYLVTYFVLVSVVNMLTSSWTALYLAEAIRMGELARWMIRPASTHWEGIANNVAEKVVKLVLLLPMVAVLALIFHHRMHLPADPGRWLAFAAATVLAAAIVFALNVLTGALAFWFEDVSGYNRALTMVSGVLSGVTVPLALMPSWSAGIIAVEPFRFTVSFPLEAPARLRFDRSGKRRTCGGVVGIRVRVAGGLDRSVPRRGRLGVAPRPTELLGGRRMMATRQQVPRPLFHARRHLAVWRQAFVQAVGREAQFRAQAFTTMAVGLLQLALSLVPVALIFGRTGEVRGWSAAAVVGVVGTFQFGLGLLETFVAPNFTRMLRYISEGELDTVLIRPISAQLFTAFRWIQPAELPGALSGLVLAGLGLALAGITPSPGQVLLAAVWFVLGLAAVTCFWANLAYVTFWSGSLNIDVALLLSPGQYPLRFFPRAVRGVLTFAVPIGVVTTIPLRALEGHAAPAWLPAGAVAVVAAAVLTRIHWRLALRRYASASS